MTQNEAFLNSKRIPDYKQTNPALKREEWTASEHFRMEENFLVTGGVGFIGSNFILQQMRHSSAFIINVDKLTYAGNLYNLASIAGDPRYEFVQGDIADRDLVRKLHGSCCRNISRRLSSTSPLKAMWIGQSAVPRIS
jgi:hypothetical protein